MQGEADLPLQNPSRAGGRGISRCISPALVASAAALEGRAGPP